jgi:hypothetical protein
VFEIPRNFINFEQGRECRIGRDPSQAVDPKMTTLPIQPDQQAVVPSHGGNTIHLKHGSRVEIDNP